jgi:hypothetical protein
LETVHTRRSYLEPSHVEEELKKTENWDVEVDLVAGVLLALGANNIK